MNPIDLKLRLLSGSSFFVDDISINPKKLNEIVDVGYMEYNQHLNLVSVELESLIDPEKTKDFDEIKAKLTVSDIIFLSKQQEFIDLFLNGLGFFLEDKVEFMEDGTLLVGEGGSEGIKIINRDQFVEIIDIIKYQNCVLSVEGKPNPKDDKAKSILEKIKKAKEKLKKKYDGDNIDFTDLVSAVTTKSNTYNKTNVWDLTIYQFYDEYKRLEAITGFETSILAMVNGAEVNLKHWSSKLDD